MNGGAESHRRLILNLQQALSRSGGEVVLIETHISSVLLQGDYAYKIKKPLNLGFLDFSTLEHRRHFCQEEVRLNRRLAPATYLGVVAITGTAAAPLLGGKGEAIEYVVKMRRFPDGGLLSQHADTLSGEIAETIAVHLERFHSGIGIAGAGVAYGEPGLLIQPMRENFELVDQLPADGAVLERSARLARWTEASCQRLNNSLLKRKEEGFIRECHGDLHLGNMTLVDGEVLIFDGIEFSPQLRWIDTMSEIAFLTMDLEERGRADLSGRLLNHYLELTGDYAGLVVLRFYQVYRAMVRAKVSAIRLGQEGVKESERRQVMVDFNTYLGLAEGYTRSAASALVITHGLSGSGKSTQATHCIESLPAIRLRSDVERKRMAGLAPTQKSSSPLTDGIYTVDFSKRVYQRLLELAEWVMKAGFIAIVDATFLSREQRRPFQQLAESRGVPYAILDCQLPESILRERIEKRRQEGVDPSEADLQVLERQIADEEPLTNEELVFALPLGAGPLDPIALKNALTTNTNPCSENIVLSAPYKGA